MSLENPFTDEDERAAVRRIHEVLASEARFIGMHEVDEEGEPTGEPILEARLEEWVLVASWHDPATGRGAISRTSSLDLPVHHENGLLHEALYKFD